MGGGSTPLPLRPVTSPGGGGRSVAVLTSALVSRKHCQSGLTAALMSGLHAWSNGKTWATTLLLLPLPRCLRRATGAAAGVHGGRPSPRLGNAAAGAEDGRPLQHAGRVRGPPSAPTAAGCAACAWTPQGCRAAEPLQEVAGRPRAAMLRVALQAVWLKRGGGAGREMRKCRRWEVQGGCSRGRGRSGIGWWYRGAAAGGATWAKWVTTQPGVDGILIWRGVAGALPTPRPQAVLAHVSRSAA